MCLLLSASCLTEVAHGEVLRGTRIVSWHLLGDGDGAVSVALVVSRGTQVLVGRQHHGPAVEGDEGRDDVDHGGHHPMHGVDVEESHHHQDAHSAAEDDVHHALDQEGDHQAADLGAHSHRQAETGQDGEPGVGYAGQHGVRVTVLQYPLDILHIIPGPGVSLERHCKQSHISIRPEKASVLPSILKMRSLSLSRKLK